MNSIMNEKQLTVVKEEEFNIPLIQKIDSVIDNCTRGCHNRFFNTFEYKCAYDIQLTNFSNKEMVNVLSSDKSMGLYKLNENITVLGKIKFFLFK